MEDEAKSTLIDLTAEMVAAYVEKNSFPRAELPGLIASLHEAHSELGTNHAEPAAEPRKPAVSIKKSVTDDYIVSFEDGRKLKTLKKHLAKLGMTPEDYRRKWGLPHEYPMVAPAYAKRRSELARSSGLGRKKGGPAVEGSSDEPGTPASAAGLPKKRGKAKRAA